jgi:hypothetical protein
MEHAPYATGDRWRHPGTERAVTVVDVTDRTVTYRTHGMVFRATTDGFERLLDGSSLVRESR